MPGAESRVMKREEQGKARSEGKPDASVVVPARNRAGDLRRCLAAMARQDYPLSLFEVIVCDDGSDEDLRPAVEEAGRDGLRVRLVRQQPKGPAAARNLGIRHAAADIVAMTDSDTVPGSCWLSKLCEALSAHPEAVGVEGRVGAAQDDEHGPLGEGPTNLSGGVYLTCNCAYRRKILVRVGGFDETFPYPAYEDTDLAACAQAYGPIVWQPEAQVLHPRRRLTLRTVFRKLRHWEYVTLMGYRYGYLAWRRYPVRHPRIRVALLSTLALPLSKLRASARWAVRDPLGAARLAFFAAAEAAGALVLVTPRLILGSYSSKAARGRYLSE